MINLVGTSPKTAIEKIGVVAYRDHCGLLTSPKSAQNPAYAAAVGARWAMDNDAFTEFRADKFIMRLQQWRYVPNCLFVVAPDVIQDARGTLHNFWLWQPVIKAFGLPAAFVLQNGITMDTVPFDYADALFVGGDDMFKQSPLICSIVREAKRRNLWVHHGRVNGRNRIQQSILWGCDSIDGTGYAIDPSRIKNELHLWTTQYHTHYQPTLFED